MAMRKKIYRRIAAGGFSAFEYVRLYQGPDHLLEVYSFGYTETYRRFFFGDIQAFTIQMTTWGKIGNIVLSLTGGLLTLLVLASGGGALGGVLVGGPFALILLVNLMLGPTCATYIQTAVQRQRLRGLNRVRTVRRLLARLATQIQAAQGAVAREELLRQLRDARVHPSVRNPAAPQTAVEAPPVIDAPPVIQNPGEAAS
jgi:hypothetical protein